jgi:hypothetical protein
MPPMDAAHCVTRAWCCAQRGVVPCPVCETKFDGVSAPPCQQPVTVPAAGYTKFYRCHCCGRTICDNCSRMRMRYKPSGAHGAHAT